MLLSSVAATRKRNRWLQRTWAKTDFIYIGFMAVMHGLCLLAPATFSWPMVGLFFVSYFITGYALLLFAEFALQPSVWLRVKSALPSIVLHSAFSRHCRHQQLPVCRCLGITLSFHRQLSHRAFQTPKWLEYALAYCGVLAVQVPLANLILPI